MENVWRRSFYELLKNRLVDQFEADGDQLKIIDADLDESRLETESNAEEVKIAETLIKMPIFVRNFSENMMSDEKRGEIDFILSEWFETKLHHLYVFNQNVRHTKVKSGKYNKLEVSKELEKMDTNIKAFIERMVEKHKDEVNEIDSAATVSEASDDEEASEPAFLSHLLPPKSPERKLPKNPNSDNLGLSQERQTLGVAKILSYEKPLAPRKKTMPPRDSGSGYKWSELREAYNLTKR